MAYLSVDHFRLLISLPV